MTREQELLKRRAFSILASYPALRAETIAQHYLTVAAIAQEVLVIVRLARGNPTREAKDLIDHHIKTITDAHTEAFGIELNWDTPQ